MSKYARIAGLIFGPTACVTLDTSLSWVTDVDGDSQTTANLSLCPQE